MFEPPPAGAQYAVDRLRPIKPAQEVIGSKEVGLVEYRFQPDAFEVRHVRVPGQIDVDLDFGESVFRRKNCPRCNPNSSPLVAYTVVTFDLSYLRQEFIPNLAAKYFASNGKLDYKAVKDRAMAAFGDANDDIQGAA